MKGLVFSNSVFFLHIAPSSCQAIFKGNVVASPTINIIVTRTTYHILQVTSFERAVWGNEKSSSGTHHLQGYLELSRSFRLGFLKRILQSAHWYAVNGNSNVNFDYCTKSGNFDFYGDFSKEMSRENSMKPLAPALPC